MKYLSLAALLVVCLGFTGCEPLNKISSWCGCASSSSEAVADDSAEVADDVADDSSVDSDSTDS